MPLVAPEPSEDFEALLRWADEARALGVRANADMRENPFETLDQEGVGELVHMARERGRQTNARLKLGVCGEHGGDPKSVAFFHAAGLDYVSCSPFRVPGARLAAAQAALTEQSPMAQPV